MNKDTRYKMQDTNKSQISIIKRFRIWNLSIVSCFLLGICFLFLAVPSTVLAQESLGISITPALFQMNLTPGQSWTGQLKVINPNPYEITYYASVVNFQAANEKGQPKFVPIVDEDPNASGSSLAYWIDITQEPIVLAAEKSVNLPFSITVPDSASPGGHYAAILIGQKPPKAEGITQTSVSSFVSSLLFVRIAGDVHEEGFIREFSTGDAWYQAQEAEFNLKFENVSNVHLRPVGEIAIYNMWGKERGTIDINHTAGFGNVLPGTVRDFSFRWDGEDSVFDIGRYHAELTLQYGEDGHKNIDSTLNFWVVPLKSTLGILGGFGALIFLTVFLIRWYIKRAFKLQAMALGIDPSAQIPKMSNDKIQMSNEVQNPNAKKGKPKEKKSKIKTPKPKLPFKSLAKNYKFLVITSVVLVSIAAGVFYFRANLIPERSFEIIIEKQGTSTGTQVE